MYPKPTKVIITRFKGCNGGILQGSIYNQAIPNDILVCLPSDLWVSENGKYTSFEGR